MGFVLTGVGGGLDWRHKVAFSGVAVLGILLSITVLWWSRQFRDVKNFKYRRCKAIEEELGMQQHTGLPYKAGTQTHWHMWLMVAFIATWLLLLGLVLSA